MIRGDRGEIKKRLVLKMESDSGRENPSELVGMENVQINASLAGEDIIKASAESPPYDGIDAESILTHFGFCAKFSVISGQAGIESSLRF